jgi:NADH-quinone oxidoreductase subunit J
MQPLLDLLTDHWRILLAAIVLMIAVGLLLPGETRKSRLRVAALAAAAVACAWSVMFEYNATWLDASLFYLFAGAAVGASVLMISSRNPVYAALWFALATLAVCGLFVLRTAPFLAAATVIVYAGAIIVTFLFVVMLASQSGTALYDQRASQPFSAVATGTVLLFAFLLVLTGEGSAAVSAHVQATGVPGEVPIAVSGASNTATSEAPRTLGTAKPGTLLGLGSSLFGEYLLFVELAGTLLLTAAVGAIAIAPRRKRGAP